MAIFHGNSYVTLNRETDDLELIKRQVRSAQSIGVKENADGTVNLALNFWEDSGISNPFICSWGDSYTYTLSVKEYDQIKISI